MKFRDLMQMDMATLGRQLSRGLSWWIGELRGMLPARWRGPSGPRAFLTLEAGRLVLHRPSPAGWTRIEAPTRKAAAGAVFAVPPESVLVGEFDYPVPSPADLARMIELDLDRLTPFRPADVVFDVMVDTGGGGLARGVMRRITLALMRRDDLDALKAQLATHRVAPAAIALVSAEGRARFDFQKAAGGTSATGRWRTRLWLLVGLLVALNIGIAVVRDRTALDRLRDQVEGQRPLAQRIAALRRGVTAEDERRAAFVALKQGPGALDLLQRLTVALPDGVWLESLDWQGRDIRIAGHAPAGTDVAALVAAAGLEVAAPAAWDGERFDLTARLPEGTP
ncbi:PilN domain-containing protein [Zavarzinia compransoris]|uniref:PilN domain-containing protein n=1 Tax=Zavarzinia marina TaxID=2911065 RepID=UPI001F3D2738|nr:PilN domain-containing protein [Zavarzinia marina]MCF4164785.1 PilN domain-containing protein [Zavarzinia marina]